MRLLKWSTAKPAKNWCRAFSDPLSSPVLTIICVFFLHYSHSRTVFCPLTNHWTISQISFQASRQTENKNQENTEVTITLLTLVWNSTNYLQLWLMWYKADWYKMEEQTRKITAISMLIMLKHNGNNKKIEKRKMPILRSQIRRIQDTTAYTCSVLPKPCYKHILRFPSDLISSLGSCKGAWFCRKKATIMQTATASRAPCRW